MSFLRRSASLLRSAVRVVSPLGRTVLAVAAVCWVLGVVWNWQEAQVIAAVGLVLFLIAIGFTVGRLDLRAEVGVDPARVVVGERAAGELTVTNRRRRAIRSLRLELPVGRALAVFSVPHLKGESATDELFVVPTNKRAVIPVGPLTSVQGDPLGMLRRTNVWTGIEEIYVHPKTTSLSTIAAGQIRDLEGQTTNALTMSDIAFHTLREYVHGDDLRHVHWKTSAKIGELMMRQYNDTRRSHVAVLLSTNTDEFGSDNEFELAVSCAASIAVQAIRDDQTLTVIVGDEQFPSIDPIRLLDRFSGIEGTSNGPGIEAALKTARRIAADASMAVLCIGSRLDVPEIRRATSRAALDIDSVVLRAAEGTESGYRVIGSSRFVNVPELETLNRGLTAVV